MKDFDPVENYERKVREIVKAHDRAVKMVKLWHDREGMSPNWYRWYGECRGYEHAMEIFGISVPGNETGREVTK